MSAQPPGTATKQGIGNKDALLKFLAGRYFAYRAQEEEDAEANEEEEENVNYIEAELGSLSLEGTCKHIGYNGRWNKKADTCYYWWVVATLSMLGEATLAGGDGSRRFILDHTQHRIGGFAKSAGGPPDIYHSYLGLAALATMGEEGLKEFDVGLCCTKETTAKLAKARDGLLDATRKGDGSMWQDDGFWS